MVHRSPWQKNARTPMDESKSAPYILKKSFSVLTLCRLRVNIPEKVLADNYNVSVSEVSRIFAPWVDLLYSRLIQLPVWASKRTIKETSISAKVPAHKSSLTVLNYLFKSPHVSVHNQRLTLRTSLTILPRDLLELHLMVL